MLRRKGQSRKSAGGFGDGRLRVIIELLAQEALIDKVTCEQKPKGAEGVDHANSGVKTMTNRGKSRFKDRGGSTFDISTAKGGYYPPAGPSTLIGQPPESPDHIDPLPSPAHKPKPRWGSLGREATAETPRGCFHRPLLNHPKVRAHGCF